MTAVYPYPKASSVQVRCALDTFPVENLNMCQPTMRYMEDRQRHPR